MACDGYWDIDAAANHHLVALIGNYYGILVPDVKCD